MVNLRIIDVSKYDEVTNWKKVAENVDGVIIRAGYRGTKGGLVTDPLFKSHMDGAVAADIPRIGVYWWTAHISVAQAKEDAEYLLRLLEPYRKHINFCVWLDSEASGSASTFNKLSATVRTECALAFLSAIKDGGYPTGIYASDSWFKEKLVMSKVSSYPAWVAKYSSTPPKNVKGYVAWQYTEKGKCQGVRGDVDVSHFYADFAAPLKDEQKAKEAAAAITEVASKKEKDDGTYVVGKTYKLCANMRVRKGPGTMYESKRRDELTVDGRRHCAGGMDVAILLSGTKVTCVDLSVQKGGAVWMKIPSGWVCAIGSAGKVYVK